MTNNNWTSSNGAGYGALYAIHFVVLAAQHPMRTEFFRLWGDSALIALKAQRQEKFSDLHKAVTSGDEVGVVQWFIKNNLPDYIEAALDGQDPELHNVGGKPSGVSPALYNSYAPFIKGEAFEYGHMVYDSYYLRINLRTNGIRYASQQWINALRAGHCELELEGASE